VIIDTDRLDLARRANLISHAEGADLLRLCELYSLPYIARLTDNETQRAALRATLYSARGTPAALFGALREIYRPYEQTLTGATLTPAELPTLTHPELTAEHAGAWIEATLETGAYIYHIAHATEGSATLTPTGSSYHARPPRSGEAQQATLKILAFTIREPHPSTRGTDGGLARPCEVILETAADLSPAPPTYARDPDQERELGEPLGGHLTTAELRGSQIAGPYPLYMAGEEISASLRSYLEGLLAAGVRLSARLP
jgi:hypothetical protein